MSKPWCRLYNDVLTDSKLARLPLDKKALYFLYLAVSSREDRGGSLPNIAVISKIVGERIDRVRAATRAMIEVGLIDENPDTKELSVHGWSRRQFESDDVNARSKKHRKGRNATLQPPVTCNDPRVRGTDTETDTEKEPPYPPTGERRSLITVVEGENDGRPTTGQPPPADVAAPGSAEYQRAMAAIPQGWMPTAERSAINLLSRFPAVAVLYGLEETLEKFEGPFTRKAAGFWAAVAEDNPTGRPARAQSRTRQQPLPIPPVFHRASPVDAIPVPNQPRLDSLGVPQRPLDGPGRISGDRPDRSDVQSETTPPRRSQKVS